MDPVIERITKLAKDGFFGGGDLKTVVLQSDDGKGSQFASKLFFLRVDLLQDTGKVNEIPVVVKIKPESNDWDGMFVVVQFANEVAMYDKIMPKLGANELGIIPRMFYGLSTHGEDPNEDIVIVEDMRSQGFKVSKDLFLDRNHLTLALRNLGKFHGLSYKIKKSSPETLSTLGKYLERKIYDDPDNVLEICLKRGFKELLKNPAYSYLENVFKKLTDPSLVDTKYNLEKSEEPFAAIIHGDFNNNNLLFAYESNKVSSVKFIDFGASFYSDPAVDISFFLYMNTSEEMRAAHWDDLLEEYWKGVTSIVEDPGFSFEAFLKNFAKKAICGYFPCSFFLPMMLVPDETNFDFGKMTLEEKREFADNFGGEKGTEATTSIVRHLSDKGYLEEFLLNFTNEPRST
uniref:Putative kinase-like protein D1044.1 n=1 Tax=Lygus hesperus TaxID=30085 RepID=A0A0A9WDD3_LYGHE